MAVYSDLIAAGNTSGLHVFDAAVIQAAITAFSLEEVLIENTAQGPVVLLRDDRGPRTTRLRKLLVHWGARFVRNDAVDEVVIALTDDLATIPGAMQDILATYEQTPYGRRVGNRPPQGS